MMRTSMNPTPPMTPGEAHVPVGQEGDVNQSPNRGSWREQNPLPPHAQALVARDAEVFLHQSVSSPCLSAIRKAEGIWIEEYDGRRYMDFHGNNVHHIGYGHPRLTEAVRRQMMELPFAPRRYTCETAVECAEKLASITPAPLSKVLFATGGSDAIEMALKLARAATGRFKTLSFWDSFHGAGFGASSVGGESMFRGPHIGPLLPGAEHVPPYGDYRNAWGVTAGSAELCAAQIRYVLEKEGDIAAFIAEPMRASPNPPPPGFWEKVREACDATGTLLIFDEIPTGLGKTGRMFSCQQDGAVPDILVLGKSLGGGLLPISAIVCHPELDVGGQIAIGHYTHEKNPVTCRAALTTIEIIEDDGLVEHAARLGDYALERLWEMRTRHPLIGDVRGRGLLFAAELVADRDSREPANAAADRILYRALARGLSFKTTMGNVLTFGPPLVVTQAELDSALDIIDVSLADEEREAGLV